MSKARLARRLLKGSAVLAMLVGFVLLAALFVLTSLFGLNLPLSR